jgi:3-hydroxyacyl-CoA dehydrogenase
MDSRKAQGRAVVLGAGVMGAQIAAHLANAGWSAALLDIVPEGAGEDRKSRSALAAKGLERAQKARPAAFFLPEYAARLQIGNMADDLALIRDADWVIEAVVEKPDIKQQVLAAIEPHLGPETLVTTNTSGLSIAI